jgi:hypothetical protein
MVGLRDQESKIEARKDRAPPIESFDRQFSDGNPPMAQPRCRPLKPKAQTMTLSTAQEKFTLALCREHLEQAGFLYTHCSRILSGTAAWTSALGFEQQLWAHLDALAIEGAPALECCLQTLDRAPAGEWYIAARLCCLNGRMDPLAAALEQATDPSDKRALALCDALTDAACADPGPIVVFLESYQAKSWLIAKVGIGARLKEAWPLVAHRRPATAESLALVLRLAGRIGPPDAVDLLQQSLGHDDPGVVEEAALALLRHGRRTDVLGHFRTHQKPVLAAVLAADTDGAEHEHLLTLARKGPLERDLLIGLGLMGAADALPVLVDALDHEPTTHWAAVALELITGAGIAEPVVDRAGWRQWLQDNRQCFAAGTLYRNGLRRGPQQLIETMASTRLAPFVRQLAAEELAIGYQKDFAFEIERPATFQKTAIAQYRQWAQTLD